MFICAKMIRILNCGKSGQIKRLIITESQSFYGIAKEDTMQKNGYFFFHFFTIFPTWPGQNPSCFNIPYLGWSEFHLLQYSLSGVDQNRTLQDSLPDLITIFPIWPGQNRTCHNIPCLVWSGSCLLQYSLPGTYSLPGLAGVLLFTIIPTWNLLQYSQPGLVGVLLVIIVFTWPGQYFLPDLVGTLLVTVFPTWPVRNPTYYTLPYLP